MVLAWGNRRFPRRTGRACASWPKDAGGVRLDRTPRQCDPRACAGISKPSQARAFQPCPGQGDGAGPCRRRAGRAIPQRRIARRPVVRSGPAKGRGNRGKIVTRRAEICGPHRTMPPRRSAGSGRDGGRRTWGQGRAARKARGVGRCSRRTSRARSWAGVSSRYCTRSRTIRMCHARKTKHQASFGQRTPTPPRR